jgi:hypothetical protein
VEDLALEHTDKTFVHNVHPRHAEREPGPAAASPRFDPGGTEAIAQREAVPSAGHGPRVAAQAALVAGVHASPCMATQQRQIRQLFGDAAPQASEGERASGVADRAAQSGPIEARCALGGASGHVRFPPTVSAREDGEAAAQRQAAAEAGAASGHGGLPEDLKAGIESLSGLSMDRVRVHRDSAQPAQLNARAFAQGGDVHLGPGQERHLPHEAWHVVQQAQGRVRPTLQMKGGVAVNDDEGLEREADLMGEKAAGVGASVVQSRSALASADRDSHAPAQFHRVGPGSPPAPVAQLQESLEEKIKRILGQRKIDISDSDATDYAVALTTHPQNTPIPVAGRHRALKLNSAGVVSSVAWRPASDASRMRVSPMNGPMNQEESSMLTEGPRPLTGAMLSQDATIDAATLADIPERDSLGRVMGGSASKLSGIQNSEWLHLVAHSLGGADAPTNVQAGSHSLNTAMIPFERLVRSSARAGRLVDYQVTFFSDAEGDVAYVHHVQIGITLPGGQAGTWTLEVNRDRQEEFINGQVLAEIEGIVAKFSGAESPPRRGAGAG